MLGRLRAGLKRRRDPRVERSAFSKTSYLVMLWLFMVVTAITLAFLFQDIDFMALMPRGRLEIASINFLAVCALATLAWGLWRNHTTRKPVDRILAFTEAVTSGDFGARIPPSNSTSMDEFDVISADLNRMAEELGSMEALRTDFVSNVSHEMKTPLTVISNYTTIMQDPSLSEEERIAYARKCSEAARRLSGMVGDILRMNKLDNQIIQLNMKRFDLTEELAECIMGADEALERAGLELEADLAEGVTIEGDRELLGHVWANLLSNACKFTDAGGTVGVTLSRADDRAVVTVSDTGVGMDEATARHVFDKFYQGDMSRATQGNGLGLALAERIVDLHGGRITVESEPGVGTTFTVTLGTYTPS